MKKNYSKLSISAHKKYGGKIELTSKIKLKTKDDLSIAYTPGVGAVCMQIFNDSKTNPTSTANKYTLKKNTIAVLSDGSAVLGLGNIGPLAAIPVMEGKAVIMKEFAGVDAFPICLNTQDTEEIIKTVKFLEPVFGGINLEDISAPRCFEIEKRLKEELNIPVMHDDQWGAATVTLAAAINAFKVVKKDIKKSVIVVSGVGAAGLASIRLLNKFAPNAKIFAVDSKGVINSTRTDLNSEKIELLKNKIIFDSKITTLEEALVNADIFIGLSKPGLLNQAMIRKMSGNPIIFALANPTPEIMPDVAKKTGVAVMATGRSDFPNQINNSIFFPGFWRGMLDRQNKGTKNANKYNLKLFVNCAENIAKMVKPNKENILPSTLDKKIHLKIAHIVANYKFVE